MKELLLKELKLAMHPAAIMFIALSALLIIPNYPYYVTYFYTSLGIFFICLSGLATGGSWLCYYRALQLGPASVVVPIDKLSILVTVAFSCLILREKLSRRAALGLLLIVAGTLLMLVPV